MSMLCAVLDTNILVSVLLSPSGNPAKIFRLFLAGTLDLVISDDILVKYEDVLYRSRLQLPAVDVQTVLASIQEYAIIVNPVSSTIEMIDEDDRVFYDTAKSVRAYLSTGNIKHYPQESFILTPTEFIVLE